jgi:antirestriction protein ArdC
MGQGTTRASCALPFRAASKSRSRQSFDSPTAEEKIVASMIELMEAGSAHWQRPWDGSGGGHHVHLLTGPHYRGASPVLLTLGRHIRVSALPLWCSFAEAKKHGSFPRKGSKAVHIQHPEACLWLAVVNIATRWTSPA